MLVSTHLETWPTKTTFRITGQECNEFEELSVTLVDGDQCGRGSGLGVSYLDDVPHTMLNTIEEKRDILEAGLDRQALQELLPAGGARNAIDAALWDLEAKLSGLSIWELTGIDPRPLETVLTIGLEDTPEDMAQKAFDARVHKLLKVKLSGDRPVEKIRAIRRARPDARLIVDANQGWSFDQLEKIAPAFADVGVEMIEQPLPRDQDEALENYRAPLPLCADESCQHLGEIRQAAQRYQMVNIKLDKTGGLTHALELVEAARGFGLGVMVGCMGGTSLAMAPSFVLGCVCDLVDIDGPLLLRSDCVPGLTYRGGWVEPFDSQLWG